MLREVNNVRHTEVDDKDTERRSSAEGDDMKRARLDAERAAAQRATPERPREGGDKEDSSTRVAERASRDAAEGELRGAVSCRHTAREFEEAANLRAGREAGRRELYEQKQSRHEARYQELMEKTVSRRVEWKDLGDSHVRVDDILEPERGGERLKVEDANFWNHHGNSYEFYRGMAEKYPQLRERLGRGETLDHIKSDEGMRAAVEFWYSKEPVVLEKYKDSHFIEGGYHRYMLGRKFDLGEIPAHVKEARDR
jgi:hypothetical protein